MDKITMLRIKLSEKDLELRYWQEVVRDVLRCVPLSKKEEYSNSDERMAYQDGVNAQAEMVAEMLEQLQLKMPPALDGDDG